VALGGGNRFERHDGVGYRSESYFAVQGLRGGEIPQWKAARVVERFSPRQKAHIVCERYPFWPEEEVLEDAETYLVPDHVFGERTVWRITLPDGKPLAVVINGTRAAGLQARLTDEMIEVKKEGRAAKVKPV
jgi:hypothetical protein